MQLHWGVGTEFFFFYVLYISVYSIFPAIPRRKSSSVCNTSVSRADLPLQPSVSELQAWYLKWATASGWNLVMQVVCGHS